MWYWYFTGMCTVLFALSLLFNVGLATGYIKYHRQHKPKRIVHIYDQDNSGSHKRSA